MAKSTKPSKKKGASSEKLALIMWALLTRENAGAFQKELKPEPSKPEREALAKEGLVRWESRSGGIWIEVTDQGWEWAGKNLAAPLPIHSKAGNVVLHDLLVRLQRYLQVSNLVLVDILDPQPAQPPTRPQPKPKNGPANIRQRIRKAYLDVTKGRLNTRALLRDVRVRLADVDRATLDEALKQMQQDKAAILYQLDNRAELTDADREAAIHFAGEPRHILWIER